MILIITLYIASTDESMYINTSCVICLIFNCMTQFNHSILNHINCISSFVFILFKSCYISAPRKQTRRAETMSLCKARSLIRNCIVSLLDTSGDHFVMQNDPFKKEALVEGSSGPRTIPWCMIKGTHRTLMYI